MKKILIVEDESDIRKLTCDILEREGYRVETAEDGIAGLEAIGWFKPELVLLNVTMPRMDGFTMLKTLGRAHPPELPRVIMTTGGWQAETLDLALSLGAIDCLYYPYKLKVLTRIVREALDPALDGAQRMVIAKFHQAMRTVKYMGCARANEAAMGLPLGKLSVEQHRDLREGLFEAAKARIEELESHEGPAAKRGEFHPGVESALVTLALSRIV